MYINFIYNYSSQLYVVIVQIHFFDVLSLFIYVHVDYLYT